MSNTFLLFLGREWQLLFRNTSTLVQPLCFFVIIALLFPFSLPVENALLQRIGAGVTRLVACDCPIRIPIP